VKKLESSNEKNVGATNKIVATVTLILVFVAMISLHSTSEIIIPDTAPQLAVAEEAQLSVNNIKEMNFSSPFNNSFNLGTPFLVEYDDTTSLKAIEKMHLLNPLMLRSKVMILLMV
jgi:hypothetical protein